MSKDLFLIKYTYIFLETGSFTQEWEIQRREMKLNIDGQDVEYVVLSDHYTNTDHLLTAASRLTSIPLDLQVKPVVVGFTKSYLQDNLNRVEHLLQMLLVSGVKLELNLENYYDGELLPIRKLFRFLPVCHKVSFANSPLDMETIIAIGKEMSSQKILLKSMNFQTCSLTDETLKHVLPHLPSIEDVMLNDNQGITKQSYKSLHDVITFEGHVALTGLCADYTIVKKVKKIFKRLPGIQIRC